MKKHCYLLPLFCLASSAIFACGQPSSSDASSAFSSSSEPEPTSSVVLPSSPSVEEPSSSEEPKDFWDMDLSTYGETFLVSLGKKINATRTKKVTYSQCKAEGAKAAAFPEANSSTFIPFYHAPVEEEMTTFDQCNREHVWPNSRGGGSKRGGENIECDPLMIRPTLINDNSGRENYFYGTKEKSSQEWDPASCGYEGARGESARVIFYAVACYAKSNGLCLTNNPSDATSLRSMGTLKTLLKWNRDYPPSDFEITVNERYAAMGHARNAFVDHPEFADYIYDDYGFRASVPAFEA